MTATINAVLVVALSVSGCGNLPQTRYYQLVTPAARSDRMENKVDVLVLDSLATDPAYDDERIVYRATPYRIDYYQYHRWSATPGIMVANYLEQALENSGHVHSVVRELTSDAAVVLGGRVVAIEEVDESRARWHGRIAIELTLSDPRTGAMLWTEQFEEIEPLTAQTPEGLARALSTAMQRIATKAAPVIGHQAARARLARTR